MALTDLIHDDIKAGLSPAFVVSDPLIVTAPFADTPLATPDGRYGALPWSVQARHEGPFVGLARTGRVVTISGVTIVDQAADGGTNRFLRIVDWSAVLAQLGAGITGRTAGPT